MMAAAASDYNYPGTTTALSSHPVYHDAQFDMPGSYNDFASPVMSRAESVASDGQSVVSTMTANTPSYLSTIRPAPEYVSPLCASQAATESQYASVSGDDEDQDALDRNGRVAVAEGALALVNGFLDKLLYDILATARSTSLLALKPAVLDVLRKSLARDAIARAQGDLEDLLALQDSDEDDQALRTPKELGKWNMEFMWKRTRLRVMMRSEKSDFDIDDDERYVQEEGLFQGRRFSQTTVISLSAEIFLAGVLDFVAEQLLAMGSSAAATRTRRQGINAKADPGLQGRAHILVQEPDVEKAALNSSMERLWRGWRKSLRASTGRRASRSITGSPILTRRGSVADSTVMEEKPPNIPDMNHPEHVLASNIPLPMSSKDVDEIEVPWLARDPDEKVPQHHVADGRFNHRPVRSVGNFSYFRPMGAKTNAESRPSTSPQPVATPFIDAPGAWPQETPLQETPFYEMNEAWSHENDAEGTPTQETLAQPPLETAPLQDMAEPESDLGHVPNLKNEALDRSTDALTAPAFPDKAVTEARTSPIPTLEPSQLDLPPLDTNHALSVNDDYGEANESEMPHDHEAMHPIAVTTATGFAGAAAALPAVHASGYQAAQGEVRLSDEFRRKSIGDMRSLVTDNAVQRHDTEPSQGTVTGTFLDEDESADEDARPESMKSMYTTQSYTLNDRSMHQVKPERATPQHMPTGHNDSSDTLVASSPVVAQQVSKQSPVLPSVHDVSPVAPLKSSERRPLRLPIATKNSPGRHARDVSQDPASASPRNFLASRNLSPTSSSSPGSPREQRPRSPNTPTGQATPGATISETPKVTATPHYAVKEAPRALQGLGISRQTSDEFKNARRGSPVQPTGSEDLIRSGRSSNTFDADPSTPGSNRNSLKHYLAEKIVNNMDEAGRSNSSLTKLTSASITSPEDFDMMVQSNDTIKYTLTPESARDVPVSDLFAANFHVETDSDSKSSAFNPQVKVVGRARVNASKDSVSSIINGKRSQPSPIDTDLVGPRPSRGTTASPATAHLPKQVSGRRKSSVSRPAPKNVKPTTSGGVAREPQVQTSSTLDFADFIRTTGPGKDQDTLIPLLASRSTQSLRTLAANSQSPSGERARSLSAAGTGRSNVETENIPPVPAMPSAVGGAASSPRIGSPRMANSPRPSQDPRSNLKARGASGSADANSSSDLIDFIRNGPQEAGGANRIPKNIAPFRNTMDSDELKLLSDKIVTNDPHDTPSKPYGSTTSTTIQGNAGAFVQSNHHHHRPNTAASTSISSQPPSTRSSTNSQARLIPPGSSNSSHANAMAHPAHATQPSRLNVPGSSSGGPPAGMVERKRHRNKDPYPIDDSEDEDLLTALPKDRRPEESLMDFLRHSEPPSNNAPKPLAAAGHAQARAMMSKARVNTVNSLRAAMPDQQAGTPTHTSRGSLSTPASSTSPITSSPSSHQHPSSYAPSVAPSIQSTTSNAAVRPAHITAQITSAGSIPRNPNRARMEVKGAGEGRRTARLTAHEPPSTGTGDLADFFRSSGPPEPPAARAGGREGAPAPVLGRGDSGQQQQQKAEKKKSSGAKFWKRKTYLDMP